MTVHELTQDRARESEEQHRASAAASPVILANPAALGLAGFALANLLLNVINAGWLPQSAMPAVLPLAFFAGGIAQLIAAVCEFRRGNTFGVNRIRLLRGILAGPGRDSSAWKNPSSPARRRPATPWRCSCCAG